jgi:hypothetical protein
MDPAGRERTGAVNRRRQERSTSDRNEVGGESRGPGEGNEAANRIGTTVYGSVPTVIADSDQSWSGERCLETDSVLRWVVLFSFSVNAFLNSAQVNDFSSGSKQSEMVFFNSTSDNYDKVLEWQYSVMNFTTAICMLPAIIWLAWDLPSAHVFLTLTNVVGALMRYQSTADSSYSICLASSVALGVAQAGAPVSHQSPDSLTDFHHYPFPYSATAVIYAAFCPMLPWYPRVAEFRHVNIAASKQCRRYSDVHLDPIRYLGARSSSNSKAI